jgi:hypothetical protein
MSEAVIRAENLGRDFKTVRALDGLDLEVRASRPSSSSPSSSPSPTRSSCSSRMRVSGGTD